VSKYEVQDAPVSYKNRLYSKGETVEASKEEAAGWLQAGYVKEVEAKKASRKKYALGIPALTPLQGRVFFNRFRHS
jgi:hypothetical protein